MQQLFFYEIATIQYLDININIICPWKRKWKSETETETEMRSRACRSRLIQPHTDAQRRPCADSVQISNPVVHQSGGQRVLAND